MKLQHLSVLFRRGIASFLIVCLMAGITGAAEEVQSAKAGSGKEKTASTVYSSIDEYSYRKYREKNAEADAGAGNPTISGVPIEGAGDKGNETYPRYTDSSGKTIENVLLWGSGKDISYHVTVEKTGLYTMTLCYLPVGETGNTVSFCLKLDGESPFTEAQTISLPRAWRDAEEGQRSDAFGNAFTPEQVNTGEFLTRALYDDSGAYNDPFVFYLTAGSHTISFTDSNEPVLLAGLSLQAPYNPLDYEQVSADYPSGTDASEPIVLEGEEAAIKDTRSIVPKSDTSSAVLHPADYKKQLLNYIGGSNWKSPGERVIWKFRVEESGLYDLRLIVKQDQTVNGYSYRSLEIDGKAPFRQAEELAFYYDTAWYPWCFEDQEGQPYFIYLEEGDHTLALTATLGPTEEYYQRLMDITAELGDLYLEIVMITGDSPDSNRDYNLFRQIRDFDQRLGEFSAYLRGLADDMTALSGNQSTSCISAIRNMDRIVTSMRNNPYTAQNYVKDYYNTYTTLSAWLYDMKAMPLSIDRIYLVPAGSDYRIEMPGFWESLLFSAKRFLVSFMSDYNGTTVGGTTDSIKIWVNWGRDQAMVLSSLIQESFTPKTGITVNLELTDATLVKGILSGNAPDLALYMARTEPVNLAMRGALYDLSKFPDYSQVIQRFEDSAVTPYMYEGGTYALPDSQSFYLMFYRSDILNRLGIEVPETWEEFLQATAVLQRNNMEAWIPYTQITDSTTVNTGVGGLNLFATILGQRGGSLYNDSETACLLDSADSLQAFTYWTDMYTKYKIPTTTSFYNRFRIGTTPLGIEMYTQYTMLAQAAPEIEGRWGVALVPGTVREDGSINRTVAGAGTGCAILATSDKEKQAWEFLKWWTDADTQLRYSNNLESILGAVSRPASSTTAALDNMAWKKADLDVIQAQRALVRELPEVPGSYYVSRAVDQAFWSVIGGASAKDSLMKWNEIANSEIERKLRQYSGTTVGKG